MSAAEPEMISGTAAAAVPAGFSASTVFLSLLIPALVLYYIYFRLSRRHMLKLAENLPGPEGLPIIGNALMFLGSSDSKIEYLRTQTAANGRKLKKREIQNQRLRPTASSVRSSLPSPIERDGASSW